MEKLLTVEQFAEILHRSIYSTRRLIKRRIGFIWDGKRLLVPESKMNNYLIKENTAKAKNDLRFFKRRN